MIKTIVPNMAAYSDPDLMLLIKTVNLLIEVDVDRSRQVLDIHNKITDIQKELDYLKKAVRNY